MMFRETRSELENHHKELQLEMAHCFVQMFLDDPDYHHHPETGVFRATFQEFKIIRERMNVPDERYVATLKSAKLKKKRHTTHCVLPVSVMWSPD